MEQNQEARSAGLLSTNNSTQRAQPQHQPTNRTWTMADVISSDHRRFLTNLFLNRELDRLTSEFFYLGDMDRTQCFSCGGVLRNWFSQDEATVQHGIHFPECLGTETRNVSIQDKNETLLAVNYPLRSPHNPHMRGHAQREQTFDRRWPAGTIRVTPAQIAEAGFFYLGERDRLKCWYCNGGLQNWELDDIPWDEHAKWFPNCQFLLRTKGQQFVSQRSRLIVSGQDESLLNPVGTSHIGSVREPDIPVLSILDPQEKMRKQKERVKYILKNSKIVRNVLAMGFAETIVETVLIDRISANPDDIYGTVSELLNDVIKKEEAIKREEEKRRQEEKKRKQEEEERRDQTQYSNFYNLSGESFNLSPANELQIESGLVASPQTGNKDQPQQNVAPIQNSVRPASQSRGVSESLREVLIRRMVIVASHVHGRFSTDLDLNRELDRTTQTTRLESGQDVVMDWNVGDKAFNTDPTLHC